MEPEPLSHFQEGTSPQKRYEPKDEKENGKAFASLRPIVFVQLREQRYQPKHQRDQPEDEAKQLGRRVDAITENLEIGICTIYKYVVN